MPCLVDSCKDQQQQQQQIEKYKAGNVVAQLPRIVAKPKEEIGVIRLSFDKQLAIRKFEKICDDLFFNNPEHYSLIEIDKLCIQQIRDKKLLICTPTDSVRRVTEFSRCAIRAFLNWLLPGLSSHSLDRITSNVSLTLIGISCCAFGSFSSSTLLEQYQHCCIIGSDSFWEHYKQVFPDLENLEPVPLHSYDICSSPYAQRYEDEQFFDEICQKFSQLINGDLELSKILYLLALVSPVGLDLERQDVDLLKEFQQKISIMIYNHLMSNSELDNFLVLQKMYQLVSLLEDLNRCGEIFKNGLITNGDHHSAEIDDINITDLL